ncbi:hypothetical protein Lepto7376_2016 [[Leptolyngbya] sp. PCC 7376]|uniref:hypothetical protein n=1 Tax=[Leptolyngbya] sp. PCC 7376 TaxID=111781 RepID=UPI00029F4C35|nr:hypothetical protein [[Leptolyngbya] sp. PCC 7376]AFY38318.1 hypothetical protein Lepto7376_2016 [[Leptolyngbya] sp. PCC 7376]
MSTTKSEWSTTEELIAKTAFDMAYRREAAAMMAEAKRQAELAADPNDFWILNDFLSARRHDLDGKYDFRSEARVFVLAQLAKEGWLEISELEGLSIDKLAKIEVLISTLM